MLSAQDIERVTASLIRAEQDCLIRAGKMHQDAHIDARTGPLQGLPRLELSVDEDGLGFDSLARLGLVEAVNRFYGLSATGIEDYLLVHRKLAEWVTLIGEHFQRVGESACLTFGSSGSTGVQGFHAHAARHLQSEVSAHLAGAFAGAGIPGRVLVSVPAHHIYGFLWGVMIPAALGCPAIDLPAGLPGPLLREAAPGDLIISTPFGLEQLAKTAQTLPANVAAVSSGGPTTARTWEAGAALGLSRMIEVYGASETGGLGWRDDPQVPFHRVADIDGQGEALTRAGAPLAVQDILDWQGAQRFFVAGRKDKVVQIAGTNVSLDLVRRTLLEEDSVADAAIRLDGERLKAFIVPRQPDAPTRPLEASLRTRLGALPPVARPDRFTFGPTLPRSASGKLQDWDSPPAQ